MKAFAADRSNFAQPRLHRVLQSAERINLLAVPHSTRGATRCSKLRFGEASGARFVVWGGARLFRWSMAMQQRTIDYLIEQGSGAGTLRAASVSG